MTTREPAPPTEVVAHPEAATEQDRTAVRALLGRAPRSSFEVVVRHPAGDPVVIRNPPLLDDGTPMAARYWLVGEPERTLVSRLESAGGVRRATEEVDPEALAAAHDRYRRERDAAVPPDWDGPVPFGGVGGTRTGIKCLHAHYGYHLAGGDDPVGQWVQDRINEGVASLPHRPDQATTAIAAPAGGTDEEQPCTT